jgi:hypothetical protein
VNFLSLPDIPTPPAIAARPRDSRGYPVPAITPWVDGVPQFASTGIARTFLCAVERRCSICGTEIPDGPVWRVVGGDEAVAITAVLARGGTYHNQAPTAEAPGHRSCMLYAAIVCPYLARPNARRGTPGSAPGLDAERGSRRGAGGAVAGFQRYEFEYADQVVFRFDGLIEFRPHEFGSAQLTELAAAVADEVVDVRLAPNYLRADEDAAQRAFSAYVRRLLG